jgi:hypothetical protein
MLLSTNVSAITHKSMFYLRSNIYTISVHKYQSACCCVMSFVFLKWCLECLHSRIPRQFISFEITYHSDIIKNWMLDALGRNWFVLMMLLQLQGICIHLVQFVNNHIFSLLDTTFEFYMKILFEWLPMHEC